MTQLPRTLVVFHSRSGHTRRIGRMLAARLQADSEEIGFDTPGAQPGYLRCALQAALGGTAAVRAARHDPAEYELVLVGTPVWCWSLPAPVRGWLEQNRLGPAQVAFFCTMGGSGARRAFAQMRRACGKAPRATLALTEAQLEAGPRAAVDAFAARLAGPHARRSGPPSGWGATRPPEAPPAPQTSHGSGSHAADTTKRKESAAGRPPRAHSRDAYRAR